MVPNRRPDAIIPPRVMITETPNLCCMILIGCFLKQSSNQMPKDFPEEFKEKDVKKMESSSLVTKQTETTSNKKLDSHSRGETDEMIKNASKFISNETMDYFNAQYTTENGMFVHLDVHNTSKDTLTSIQLFVNGFSRSVNMVTSYSFSFNNKEKIWYIVKFNK